MKKYKKLKYTQSIIKKKNTFFSYYKHHEYVGNLLTAWMPVVNPIDWPFERWHRFPSSAHEEAPSRRTLNAIWHSWFCRAKRVRASKRRQRGVVQSRAISSHNLLTIIRDNAATWTPKDANTLKRAISLWERNREREGGRGDCKRGCIEVLQIRRFGARESWPRMA